MKFSKYHNAKGGARNGGNPKTEDKENEMLYV